MDMQQMRRAYGYAIVASEKEQKTGKGGTSWTFLPLCCLAMGWTEDSEGSWNKDGSTAA